MRFLMLNWRDPENPLSGGAERVSLGYLSALRKRGHEVFWFANDFAGARAKEREIEGIRILRGGDKGSSIFAARRWYRTQPKFDLVIDQIHGIPWYAPWWCRTNCVAYLHEVLGPIWDAFYRWPLSWIGKTQERWTHSLYRNVPFWTACESTRDCLRADGVKEINIVRYGVHTVALPELPPKKIESPLKLIVVSRLAPNKRIDHAIEAVKILLEQKIPSTLTIVGGGEIEARLRAVAVALPPGVVNFTGPLPEKEKDALLKDAHFLLHTSQREGWGLNVIEANAMGTPAAVYPVAGLRESTLDNRTGFVANDETPAALARRLMETLGKDDVYQTLRRNAWDRAKRFHWSVILPKACDWLEARARGERVVAVAEE
ncbi:MAG TPA: glycosyltransferase family 4 protein [Verrucomicrobiae bacterium]|nr:glycosyltransferase family 4 protein [Verrucomicrobiae bacterium]